MSLRDDPYQLSNSNNTLFNLIENKLLSFNFGGFGTQNLSPETHHYIFKRSSQEVSGGNQSAADNSEPQTQAIYIIEYQQIDWDTDNYYLLVQIGDISDYIASYYQKQVILEKLNKYKD